MIGIFDSGVGGLTVVKEIFKYLPEYQIIYFGDTARLPYGTKGTDFVQRYSVKITDWLLKKGAKIIVIACHTSSAWASDSLKNKFAGIPIFEMITPAVKEAIKKSRWQHHQGPSIKSGQKIGIIGTPGTIKSKIYNKKIAELTEECPPEVYSLSCPLLVPLVEEGLISGRITKKIIKNYLTPLKKKNGIDTLILGCTHYPMLKKIIAEAMGKNIRIINPAENLAKELKKFLENNPEIKNKIKKGKAHQFFFSDGPYNLEKISRLCLNKKIKPIIKDPF